MRYFRSLRRQRGFIYLTTGGNGSGKTLLTLKDVRDLQLKDNRPVYFHGFDPKQPLFDFGWQPFEPEKWQDLPDGSICIIDECQDKMPTRGVGRPPDWIQAIAKEHRKRGFDFFLITQHSMNVDSFVRRLIATPGYHRHMKASAMGDSTNECKWGYVHEKPENPGSSNTGEHRSRPFPKEVYDWYTSASLHTAKKGIPRKVWLGIGYFLAALVMVGLVVKTIIFSPKDLADRSKAALVKEESKGKSFLDSFTPGKDVGSPAGGAAPLTVEEYVASFRPRLPDLPYTAPRYDAITVPKSAPYPAVCMSMGSRCSCYTDQGTLLDTPKDLCVQIVERGLYLDFLAPVQSSPAVPATAVPGRISRASPLPSSPLDAPLIAFDGFDGLAPARLAKLAKASPLPSSPLDAPLIAFDGFDDLAPARLAKLAKASPLPSSARPPPCRHWAACGPAVQKEGFLKKEVRGAVV